MANYISNPLSTLNDDLNAVQSTLSSKADKSELSDYATTADVRACLSSYEFQGVDLLTSDLTSYALSDVIVKVNEMLSALRRIGPEPPVDPTKTYVRYTDDSVSAFTINGRLGSSSIPNKNSAVDIRFGNTVTSTASRALETLPELTAVTVDDNLTAFGEHTFSACKKLRKANIPYGVTTLPGHLFFENWALSSITIPDSVTNIASGVFKTCSSLVEIDIPSSVTSIGDYSMQYCDGLSSITIPDSVTSIGRVAFQYSNNLTSVTIGSGITTIGPNVFDSMPATVTFTSKTKSQVQSMGNYPWGIPTGQDRIVCTDGTL